MGKDTTLATPSLETTERGAGALSDRVRRQLTELIRNRTLPGGQVIIELRLAERLGVSRTPLREALQRLEGEGMIEKNSGRSYMVRKVDLREYMQSLKMRLILEPEAAAMAVGAVPAHLLAEIHAEVVALDTQDRRQTQAHWDADDKLHRLFGSACGNRVMFDTIERLRVTTRLFEVAEHDQRITDDHVEHMAIITALEAGDAVAARTAVATHLRSLIAYSLEKIS